MSEPFVLPDHVDPSFPFWVVVEEDESFAVNWDPNHPVTSVFNTWTPEDFMTMLRNAANDVIAEYEEA